jgi:DNA-binding MarR family transcriptional regulator
MTKSLIEQFREIQPKFSRFYTRMLLQAGLTQPQYAVLLELLQAYPEPMTMTAVSCKLYITKPAVTNLVDRLEKSGFLKRAAHPNDRRISLLQILPPGKKIAEKIRSRFLDVMMSAVKLQSEAEKKTVQRFYLLLSERLDEEFRISKGNCT